MLKVVMLQSRKSEITIKKSKVPYKFGLHDFFFYCFAFLMGCIKSIFIFPSTFFIVKFQNKKKYAKIKVQSIMLKCSFQLAVFKFLHGITPWILR